MNRDVHVGLLVSVGLLAMILPGSAVAGVAELTAMGDTGAVVVRNEGSGKWNAVSAWRLDRVIRIGEVEGDGPASFGRIEDARLGPDGNLYVLDSQSERVQVFTLKGEFLRTIGRSGRGPGELTRPNSLAFDEDGKLWVAEAGSARYSIFTLVGDFVRTTKDPITWRSFPGQLAILHDTLCDIGHLIESVRGPGSFSMRRLGPAGVRFKVGESLDPIDTTRLTETTPRGLTRVSGGTTTTLLTPYATRDVWALAPDGSIWKGTNDRYVVYHILPKNDTARVITLARKPAPLSGADADRMRQWMRKMRASGYDGDASDLPRSYPVFTRFLATRDGYLWVLCGSPSAGNSFDVFDPKGEFLGSVPTDLSAGSESVQPHEEDGYLVGVVVDSLGVQYVQVDRVVKPTDSAQWP